MSLSDSVIQVSLFLLCRHLYSLFTYCFFLVALCSLSKAFAEILSDVCKQTAQKGGGGALQMEQSSANLEHSSDSRLGIDRPYT